MTKLTLKSLWARRRRLAGSLLAVFLGVAFLAGTLVLSDTLSAGIDGIYGKVYAGTDVSVRNATNVTDQPGQRRGMIDASVLDRVRQVAGVAAAEPVIQGGGQLLDHSGRAIEVEGLQEASSWTTDRGLNPYTITDGRPPRATGEVVINRGLADRGHLGVGDRSVALLPGRVPVTVVGIMTFTAQPALGGRGGLIGLTLADAQRYLGGGTGRVTSVAVRAVPGVNQRMLADRVAAVLPPGTEAVTGKALAQESASVVNEQLIDVLRTFLLIFAGVALLVGTFTIANTFSILIAQRSRELALLRAVGASRGQVLTSVVVEALAIGVLASVAGLGGGLGIAVLLKEMLAALGLDLPVQGLVVGVATVAASLSVGTVVTLLACAVPAVRASRVPPLAALRDLATEHPGLPRRRVILGAALSVPGLGLVLGGTLAGTLLITEGGAVATVVGMIVLGPVVARPFGRVTGALVARTRGVPGVLAGRNITRSPRRTAGAATALMIGVAVVTLFTVFITSLKTTTRESIGDSFGADLVVQAGGFGGGLDPRLSTELARLPETAAVAALAGEQARVGGLSRPLTITDPDAIARVAGLKTTAGSLRELGGAQLAVTTTIARDRKWHLGSTVRVTFPDGVSSLFTIGAIYRPSAVLGDYLMPHTGWAPHDRQAHDTTVLVELRAGVPAAAAKAAVRRVTQAYGDPEIRDRQGYLEAQSADLDQLLAIVYVMLALAILIALLSIANTLSLAVHERTHELGLLRAIGATRPQLRSMVRWESIITALFGTVGGIGLGLFLGWALVRTGGEGTNVFAAPPIPLACIMAGGAVAGVLAAIRPAHRAARLGVLDAIAAP